MENKEILKIAKKVKKALKGKTDFVSIEQYLKTIGYKVVFYNTPNGDKYLTKLDLLTDASAVPAFTYTGAGNIIFIDNNASSEDKNYLLYHELGHIALGHMEDKRLITRNKMLLEMEAETFANYLINDNTKDCKATVLLCALASAGAVIGTMLLKKAVKADV